MTENWQPACSLESLRQRARLLSEIRAFFAERGVLEVETPLLCHAIGTDPQLDFFTTLYGKPPVQENLFLQTSPEFAMKRLLAAGSGSIYQICKAFRNGEAGRYHNPEFTLLEWYRVGFSLSQLMDEVDELISQLFAGRLKPSQRHTYQALFEQHTGLDPLAFSYPDYCAYANANGLPEAAALCGHDHALWLDFLFSHQVQPHLGNNALCLVHNYPACQSSLARLSQDQPNTTERVELFINGIELGNGYFELSDALEQESRFDREIKVREQLGLPTPAKDKRLIAALDAGLPDCAGIAIGLDRLLMVLVSLDHIDEVLAFPIGRA